LMMALYLSHIRIWGIVAADQVGRQSLRLGGQPSKYRENFERKFHELANAVEAALAQVPVESAEESPAA
jgi:hypothetical protein